MEFAEPALVSGSWMIRTAVRVQERYDPNDLLELKELVLPKDDPPEIPSPGRS